VVAEFIREEGQKTSGRKEGEVKVKQSRYRPEWPRGFLYSKGKAVPLQTWSGPEGSFIVKVKRSRYRPGVAQRVPL
jgi:hypothetical protein